MKRLIIAIILLFGSFISSRSMAQQPHRPGPVHGRMNGPHYRGHAHYYHHRYYHHRPVYRHHRYYHHRP